MRGKLEPKFLQQLFLEDSGYWFFLSQGTFPEVFAKVNSAQFPSRMSVNQEPITGCKRSILGSPLWRPRGCLYLGSTIKFVIESQVTRVTRTAKALF